jgi:hypothetical protein
VQVPSTWHASSSSGTADVTCVGAPEQPCQLRLAAAGTRNPSPAPDVLGGGVLAGFGGSGCRRVGTGTPTDAATTTRWQCGGESYEQVTLPARALVAVAFAPDGPTVSAVVRTLRADPSYVRPQG